MSNTTLQSHFSESFLEKIDNFWGMTDQEQKLYKDQIFHTISDSGDQYESLNRPGLTLPQITGENDPTDTDAPSESYKTIFSPKGLTKRVGFTYEFSQRDKTMVMADTLKDLRKVMDDGCEYAAAAVFDSAGAADHVVWGMTGGDDRSNVSSALFNTAHPVSNGATQSNTGPVVRSITTAAINSIIDRMANAKNDVGLPRPLMPVGFVTGALNMTKAEQVIGARFAIENSDDVPNVMGDHGINKSGIVANPYIKSRSFWGVLSNVPMNQGLIFVDNIPLKDWKDFDAERRVVYHYVYQAVSAGFVNWRKVYGYA